MGKTVNDPCTGREEAKKAFLCRLPSCKRSFLPKKLNQRFCQPEHRLEYFATARKTGIKIMMASGMHYARLDNSARLQRVLEVLQDGKPHSTRELQEKAGVCAVGSTVGELRRNGYLIDCRYAGRTQTGRVFEYQMEVER